MVSVEIALQCVAKYKCVISYLELKLLHPVAMSSLWFQTKTFVIHIEVLCWDKLLYVYSNWSMIRLVGLLAWKKLRRKNMASLWYPNMYWFRKCPLLLKQHIMPLQKLVYFCFEISYRHSGERWPRHETCAMYPLGTSEHHPGQTCFGGSLTHNKTAHCLQRPYYCVWVDSGMFECIGIGKFLLGQ